MKPFLSWMTCPTCLGAKGVWTQVLNSNFATALWVQCPRCLGIGFVVAQGEPTFEQSAKDGVG